MLPMLGDQPTSAWGNTTLGKLAHEKGTPANYQPARITGQGVGGSEGEGGGGLSFAHQTARGSSGLWRATVAAADPTRGRAVVANAARTCACVACCGGARDDDGDGEAAERCAARA